MKKLISITGALAMLLVLVAPVGACGDWWCGWGSDDLLVGNTAFVSNNVVTEAGTGDNSIHGMFVCDGTIVSGAANAWGEVHNQVNSTEADCDCYDDATIYNRATVKNYVKTGAETGNNSIGGMFVGGGSIRSGAAGAGSLVTNLVNTTMFGN